MKINGGRGCWGVGIKSVMIPMKAVEAQSHDGKADSSSKGLHVEKGGLWPVPNPRNASLAAEQIL